MLIHNAGADEKRREIRPGGKQLGDPPQPPAVQERRSDTALWQRDSADGTDNLAVGTSVKAVLREG